VETEMDNTGLTCSMNRGSSRTLIMGLAAKLPLAQIKPFFLSLEKAGYAGDVCLFIRDLEREALDFLRDRRVNLAPFQRAYLRPKWSRFANLLMPFLKPPQRRRMKEQLALTFLHDNALRFVHYLPYLAACRPAYDHVMLADIRDVFFQRDPFAFAIPDGLSVFMEDSRMTLGTCPANARWLRAGFGERALRELGNKPISCCGTVIGTTAAMCDYLERMGRVLYAARSRDIIDQAAHNWIIHRQPPPALHCFDNDTGPVLTMHFLDPAKLREDSCGWVMNAAGQIVNTLHQYDRHPALARRLTGMLT
jgi:hypothetical protein